jgi:peptide-methionine (S)-S-oxide reductase
MRPLLAAAATAACLPTLAAAPHTPEPPPPTAKAVFAAGHYWYVEAAFERHPAVLAAVTGTANPGPNAVQAVEVTYDTRPAAYGDLAIYFFRVHDPTQRDRQDDDVGRIFRSSLLVADDTQREDAIRVLERWKKKLRAPMQTAVETLDRFAQAPEADQDFVRRHPADPHVTGVIAPKLHRMLELAPPDLSR